MALLAAMATTGPPMMCAMVAVHAPAHLFLVPVPQLVHPTTRPMVQAVLLISHQWERFVMTATTVPQMIPAMAAAHVPAYLFLVPPPQLAPPTTRPMAQAVFRITRQTPQLATTVTTVPKMIRAMAAGRVEVCLMLAQALQLVHPTTFKMVPDVLFSMQ